MAITFDGLEVASCFFYDASATTYTSRGGTGTTDLFPDDAVAEDILYFGMPSITFHDLTLAISTPLAATAVTLIWEYVAYDGTWQTLSVTDGTSGLTTSGIVTFAVPAGWLSKTITTSTRGYWIRCRISAATDITQGGAVNANKTVKNNAITITGTGNRLSDIQTANDSGSWGVVTNTNNHYQIICNLYIGNSSTTTDLTIRNWEYLELGYQPSPWGLTVTATTRFVLVKLTGLATLQLGYISGTDISEGSHVKWWNVFVRNCEGTNWGGTLKMYNSTLIKCGGDYTIPVIQSVLDIQNSVIETMNGTTWYLYGNTGTLKNTAFSLGTTIAVYLYASALTIDNLILAKAVGVLAGVNGITVSNVDFGASKTYSAGNSNISISAKNCKFTNLATQLAVSTNCTINIYYTLSLAILDEAGSALAGSNVKITDSQGTVVFNGEWSTDLDVNTYRNVKVGTGTPTLTNFNPITIEITKNGYQTQKIPYILTSKSALTFALRPAIGYASVS